MGNLLSRHRGDGNAGDVAVAEQQFTECAASWRNQGFNRGLAAALAFLAETLRLSGRPTLAQAAVREALEISSAHHDMLAMALCQRELGALALERSDLDAAQALLDESCQRLRELGDTAAYIRSRPLLVRLEVERGLFAAARQGCAELLQAVRANFMLALADAGYGLALLLAREGSSQDRALADPDRARGCAR